MQCRQIHGEPAAMTTTAPQKITFGEMRESGVRDVLIYCRDHLQPTMSRPALTAAPMMCGTTVSLRGRSSMVRTAGE